MKVEEIERTLQNVAVAIGQLTQAAVHADEQIRLLIERSGGEAK